MKCIDGGACHHDCIGTCWRLHNAAPLTSHSSTWAEAVAKELRKSLAFAKDHTLAVNVPVDVVRAAIHTLEDS